MANKIHKNVFSTYNSILGTGTPVKARNEIQVTNSIQQDDQPGDVLFPAGVKAGSSRTIIQENSEGPQHLYPTANIATVVNLRMQLAEAVQNEFQNCAVLVDLLDSSTFTYTRTFNDGIVRKYQASFKINSNGILDVSWLSSRELDDFDNAGISPLLPPTVR